MHGFKSAIFEKLKNCQIAKMALLNPCMKFNFFCPKVFFWNIMRMAIGKNIYNMSQGPPNPEFMQKGFAKKALAEIENLFSF